MTLSYTSKINLSQTYVGGYIDVVNNIAYTTETGTPAMRTYNLATGAQISSITCVTNPVAVCLITSASALVLSGSSTTYDFIEIATGYRQNIAGGAISPLTGFTTNQLVASDPTNGVALYIQGSTPYSLGRITGSTQTYASMSGYIPNFGGAAQSRALQCIIFKGSGRFLVGTYFGHVYEIDSAGNIYNEIAVTYPNANSTQPVSGVGGSNNPGPTITSLAFENNTLLVSTAEGLYLYDYSTKTLLGNVLTPQNNPFILSNMASGICLGTTGINNNLFFEIECAANQPLRFTSRILTFGTSGNSYNCRQIFFNPNTGNGFALYTYNTGTIVFFNETLRPSYLRSITAQPQGTDVKFRLFVVDDTGGVGNRKILFDTFAQSPYSYRVPTGRSLIEILIWGESATPLGQAGATAQAAFGRFNT